MDYEKIYWLFANHWQTREKPSGYTENHHLYPVSIYGENDLTVDLSAREHYFAHRLLEKFENKKMAIALQWMVDGKGGDNHPQQHERHRPSSRVIGYIREKANKARSEALSGVPKSPEHRKSISEAMKGRVAHNKGTPASQEQREKQSAKMKGRKPWNSGLKGDPRCASKPPSMAGRMWINNGIINRKIMRGDPLPEGFSPGRKWIPWNKKQQ